MMLEISSAPKAIQTLADQLADRGNPLQIQSFNSPSNQLLSAISTLGSVEVLADRGQWFVSLAPPGASDYFDTAVWVSCLTGTQVSLELEPLEMQVAWIAKFLQGEVQGEYTVECLIEMRRQRAFGRMGLT